MAKIESRPGQTGPSNHVPQLQEILAAASLGTIGNIGTPGVQLQVESTMSGLIGQTNTLFDGLLETLDVIGMQLMTSQLDLLATKMELDVTQDALANLVGNIDYDECLDHATVDLMDAFASSGAADTSADGELVFDERITFSKEDIKPMLRDAIVRWVELKMAQ
jgi:hypothetical protein